VPSPGKQASLYASGHGLQVVDEVVTLEDLHLVARSVGGVLTYFNMISIWDTNDYIHAVIERGAESIRSLAENDKLPIKGWGRRTIWKRGLDFLGYRLRFYRLQERWLRQRVHRKLTRAS